MRRALGKAVRKRFDERLRQRLPLFRHDPVALVPPGCKVYRHQPRPELTHFLVLVTDPRWDNFTVECAWSTTGEFPAFAGLSFPRDLPESAIRADRPEQGSLRFRLSFLFTSRDDWWELVPRRDVEARLKQFTDAAIARDHQDVLSAMEDPPLEEALSIVDRKVDDVIDKIIEYAVPYFAGLSKRVNGV